jgi:hypothetical protein
MLVTTGTNVNGDAVADFLLPQWKFNCAASDESEDAAELVKGRARRPKAAMARSAASKLALNQFV